MKKTVILVSGKLQSGKNSFSDYMIECFEKNKKTAIYEYFAKELKKNCNEDFSYFIEALNQFSNELKSLIQANFEILRRDSFIKLNNKLKDIEVNDDNWYEDKNLITRTLLQTYGTNIMRKRVSDSYWVDKLKENINNSDADVIIITDVRFPNEIDAFSSSEYDVYKIRIERYIERESIENQHESETALDDYDKWDYKVINNKTKQALENQVELITKDIMSKNKKPKGRPSKKEEI